MPELSTMILNRLQPTVISFGYSIVTPFYLLCSSMTANIALDIERTLFIFSKGKTDSMQSFMSGDKPDPGFVMSTCVEPALVPI
jgi:hypothetical protein